MTLSRPTSDEELDSGSPNGEAPNADALAPLVLRQPAEDLGPRAQRTIARILDATRDVFLTRGYSGTTIDEISRIAEVSRASFYTYFPSKREVLLAIGARSAAAGEALLERLPAYVARRSGIATWVAEHFDLLDVHGSFAFAWTQAAHEDEEIRVAGMKRHLAMCKRMGTILGSSTSTPPADPTALGVVVYSMLERSWNYSQLYADTVDREALIRQVAAAMWAVARQPATL